MATREEIAGTIRDGIERAEATFGTLDDEQLDRQVYDGDRGWNARQVLAHLAGRSYNYDILFEMASGMREPDLGSLDIDRQNERIIEELEGTSRDELLAQMRAVHERVIERVQAAPDNVLECEFPFPSGSIPFARILMSAAGRHSIQHTREVEEALGLDDPST